MSDKREAAEKVFTDSQAAGLNRDETIIAMVQAGITLNTAQNLYKEIAKDLGLTSTRGASRKTEAMEWLGAENYDLVDRESRAAVRKEIQERFSVAEGTANDYIRDFASKAGIELPSNGPRSADGEQVFEFIKENFETMDKPAFREFMESLGRAQGSIDETWRGIVLARRLMAEGVSFSQAA